MFKKFSLIASAICTFFLVSAVRANAGTEIVRDYSAQAPPPPVYAYAPPPPPAVVVVPAYPYYAPSVRVFGYHRVFVRRAYRPFHHWR